MNVSFKCHQGLIHLQLEIKAPKNHCLETAAFLFLQEVQRSLSHQPHSEEFLGPRWRCVLYSETSMRGTISQERPQCSLSWRVAASQKTHRRAWSPLQPRAPSHGSGLPFVPVFSHSALRVSPKISFGFLPLFFTV